jgi:hypothetical protein
MKFLFNFLILIITTNSAVAQSDDKTDIKKVFESYKSAILNDNAEEALQAIDNKTRDYYINILHVTKSADSLTIASTSLVDKITILGIRARASKEEIIKMQGTDAFLFAIRKGMVGKNSVINNSVGEISIDKNFAKGELLVQGKATDVFFHFYKETAGWKFNLTELFALGNMTLKLMVEDSGKSENEFLLEILSALSGKELTNDIWKPIE